MINIYNNFFDYITSALVNATGNLYLYDLYGYSNTASLNVNQWTTDTSVSTNIDTSTLNFTNLDFSGNLIVYNATANLNVPPLQTSSYNPLIIQNVTGYIYKK